MCIYSSALCAVSIIDFPSAMFFGDVVFKFHLSLSICMTFVADIHTYVELFLNIKNTLTLYFAFMFIKYRSSI